MSQPGGSGTLLLRRWRRTDAEVLRAAWSDPEIAGESSRRGDTSIESVRSWIDGWGARFAERRAVDFAVEVRGEVVGEVGLGPIDLPGARAEIGYWVAPRHRGRGVATAAVRGMLAFVRADGRMELVAARVGHGNAASVRVLEGNGFTPHRDARVFVWRAGLPADRPR